MFGSKKNDVEIFQKILAEIASDPPTGLTKTQVKALSDINAKLTDFKGSTISEVRTHLAKPAKKPRAAKKSSSASTKKPPNSAELIKKLLDELVSLENDRTAFEARVDAIKKEYLASTLKGVTKEFAPGASPKTVADAVRILKAERNDRRRADQKAEEASKANPW
ncbi:MAG: hypothetical protein CMK09_10620 [Ponticaulis sp.]|nr:hypothetical protein [Ponticaulis sp.]|tara:strand:- start:769 stop:1263 length:495 start_codon:yes stop_codon:yes gene_type:complete